MIVILWLVITLVQEINRTKEYGKTKGTVTDVHKEIARSSSGNRNTGRRRIITVCYEAGKTMYEAKFQSLIPFYYRTGKSVQIRYDKNAPEMIQDYFKMECSVMGILFFGIFVLFIWKALKSWDKIPHE